MANVGYKNNLMQEHSAREYVQNGLVLMWDGIENVDWGIHDEYATQWRSLIRTYSGSVPYIFVDGYQDIDIPSPVGSDEIGWTKDALRMYGTSTPITKYIENGGNLKNSLKYPKTIECCFEIPAIGNIDLYTSAYYVFSASYGSLRLPIVNNKKIMLQNSNGTSYVFQTIPTTGIHTATSITQYSEDISVSRPGMLFYDSIFTGKSDFSIADISYGSLYFISLFQYNRDWPTPTEQKIHSIRIYDRELTAAEVKLNHEIDKLRFGLKGSAQ